MIAKPFSKLIENKIFKKLLLETIEFGIARNAKQYSNRYCDTDFCLYEKYTYGDVCRLLKWSKNPPSVNVSGYKFDEDTKTFPVFINYEKDDSIQDTIKYEDKFLSQTDLIAISKANRTLKSRDVKIALNAKSLGVAMHLFVRKNTKDNGSNEFYYLGKIEATGETKEFIMPNTDKKAVEIHYKLNEPVPDSLYEYLTKCSLNLN